MGAQSNAPIIIKRKKIIAAEGHHGGAWKVAYADFVTAMMAFFMLMWLLNATTEQQRKGIADYFSPTVPLSRVSAGGDGLFGGEDIQRIETLAQSGTGGLTLSNEAGNPLDGVAEQLVGQGGEAMLSDTSLRHIVTRVTDEGLVIELFDLPDMPLFDRNTAQPRLILEQLIEGVSRAAKIVPNGIAIEAHVATLSILPDSSPAWPLSQARASRVRELIQAAGTEPKRLMRVTGHADREPVDPMLASVRNNRIEIVILRDQR